MSVSDNFKIGVSFHSFAHEYLSFIWSFDEMMEKAAQLGGGIEIVGPSHHRSFPFVTPEFERTFKSAVDRFGLTPVSYGSYADPFMLPDRNLSPDELYDYTVPQIEGAAKLGFEVVRLQHFASVIAERLVPLAEKLKIKMGYELHVPLMIESARTQELLKQIETIESEYLGVIPDAGIFARSVSSRHVQEGRDMGVPENIIKAALDLWSKSVLIDEAIEKITAMGGDKRAITWIGVIWDTFGYSNPDDLKSIMKYVKHFHGKFFHIVDGDEPDLRYEELVHALMRYDYRGWVVSEYEGNTDDSFAIVQAHQDMIKRYMASFKG
ncbi:hypothetical protein [uncultured Cohaesibacter sp.]|uniref:sugar phosphate isomerase/epimerase family protein n=1 Tax=uncultured Cohaesibacter sp. TaxID=1002546 RepID=UPI00292FDC15|nr:hypothetical protein [uncultured Cohaesibacter sp.]